MANLDLDQQRRPRASDLHERRSDSVNRSAHSVDMQLRDKLAEEVLKMRYLSRLRAFLVPTPDP